MTLIKKKIAKLLSKIGYSKLEKKIEDGEFCKAVAMESVMEPGEIRIYTGSGKPRYKAYGTMLRWSDVTPVIDEDD